MKRQYKALLASAAMAAFDQHNGDTTEPGMFESIAQTSFVGTQMAIVNQLHVDTGTQLKF